jgi:hypothetical protein
MTTQRRKYKFDNHRDYKKVQSSKAEKGALRAATSTESLILERLRYVKTLVEFPLPKYLCSEIVAKDEDGALQFLSHPNGDENPS